MNFRKFLFPLLLLLLILNISLSASTVYANKLLIYMDLAQTDHLKAYGIAYWCLEQGQNVEWLLNYRGGSFLADATNELQKMCKLRGVAFQLLGGAEFGIIHSTIEENNMESVLLEKAPRMAVYVPPTQQPWDDAVRMALEYAEIPYTSIYDEEVLGGDLANYDWLHLHHEDFTGQYGRFYASFQHAAWYKKQVSDSETIANKLGFDKVSECKKAVAFKIREYIANGGFLFAMCSATDTYDIALSAIKTDICDFMFDGDAPNAKAQEQLDYTQCIAFENFKLEKNPFVYEFSNIDMSDYSQLRGAEADYFTLFEFSAKYDPIPTMLTQCHVAVINGFLGQTTSFRKELIKKHITILGEVPEANEVKYLHGSYGKGMFSFYGGHDPEDYQHRVGDPPTQLALHKNSPGYRLILNNVLFPAAKKKKLKT